MEMRSLWQSKTHHITAASILNFLQLFKGFRSFNAENLGSVGQRATKLLAIKLWDDLTLGILESGPMALADFAAIKAKQFPSANFDDK